MFDFLDDIWNVIFGSDNKKNKKNKTYYCDHYNVCDWNCSGDAERWCNGDGSNCGGAWSH